MPAAVRLQAAVAAAAVAAAALAAEAYYAATAAKLERQRRVTKQAAAKLEVSTAMCVANEVYMKEFGHKLEAAKAAMVACKQVAAKVEAAQACGAAHEQVLHLAKAARALATRKQVHGKTTWWAAVVLRLRLSSEGASHRWYCESRLRPKGCPRSFPAAPRASCPRPCRS